MSEKDQGASLAAVGNAEPVASDAASHAAPTFTPGPWALEFDIPRDMDVVIVPASWNGDFAGIIGFAEGREHPNDDGIAREEQLANAHLIAAAPELYAALKTLSLLVWFPNDKAVWDRTLGDIRQQVVAALKKAEGRSR